MGTVPLGEEETARLFGGGVQVFLRAYAPAATASSASQALPATSATASVRAASSSAA